MHYNITWNKDKYALKIRKYVNKKIKTNDYYFLVFYQFINSTTIIEKPRLLICYYYLLTIYKILRF